MSKTITLTIPSLKDVKSTLSSAVSSVSSSVKSTELPSKPKLRMLTKDEQLALLTAAVMLIAMAATKTYVFSLVTGAMLIAPTVILYAAVGTITYMCMKTALSPVSISLKS